MMLIIVIIFAMIIFIENRLAYKKQIHIHYLCIILFSLISLKIGSTLLCILLLYWLFRTLKIDRYSSLKPFILPLSILSVTLLVTGIVSVYMLNQIRTDFLGLVVRSFVVMAFWPIMIAYTIPDIKHLRKIAYFYAAIRIIEVGISGLIIYFFFYKQFYLFAIFSDLDISISDFNNPRLFSIGAPNSNDAAFVLLGALGFIAYQLFNKIRIVDLVLIAIALLSMFLTWTRSVWIFIIIYFALIIWFNKKVKKIALIFAGLFAFTLFLIAIQQFEDRKGNDERLQTHDNASMRQQQVFDYILAIPNLPFFWGMYDEPQIIASKLNIRGDFSSENYTLETFTRNGIFAGILFIVFFSYFIVSFWLTTKTYIQVHKQNKNNVAFIIAVFATYVSLFLMAQSSLFRNNLILWVMIGFMSVIKQQILVSDHEE